MPGKLNGDTSSLGLHVKQDMDGSNPDPPSSTSLSSSSSSSHPHPTNSPLEDLAWKCTKNAVAVTQYLSTHNLPQPSHHADGPSRTLPKDAPPHVQQARQGLMDAALQLFQLAAGPSEFLPNLAPGFQYVACLAWLVRYDIFHLVPLERGASVSYAELAAAASKRASTTPNATTGQTTAAEVEQQQQQQQQQPEVSTITITIPEARLRSILRMAMTTALFTEPAPGRVAHTATSALLARDADVHAWASYLATRSAPTALAMRAAHERFTPASVAEDETAYNVAFGTGLPFFEHLSSLDGASVAEFAGYMRNVTTSEGVDVRHLVGGYPWAELGGGGEGSSGGDDDHEDGSSGSSAAAAAELVKVVDVGGSTGNAALALARTFPHLRLVVQDLPANADAGRAQAAQSQLPRDVLNRVTFQGHDFTTPQPVTDGDVYLLRMILHDWPDHVAVTILRNLVPVLGRDTTTTGSSSSSGTLAGTRRRRPERKAKLLIMDTVLPAPGQVPGSVERIVRVRDLTMMQVFNSHERDLEQWKALLGAADGRLRVKRVFEPFGSAMALLEVELEEEDVSGAVEEGLGLEPVEEEEEENWDISG